MLLKPNLAHKLKYYQEFRIPRGDVLYFKVFGSNYWILLKLKVFLGLTLSDQQLADYTGTEVDI